MAKEVFQLSRAERKKIEKRRDQEFDKRIFRRKRGVISWMARIRCGALSWCIAAGFFAAGDFTSAWAAAASG